MIRWGILGCGKIARKFASDLKYVKDAQLVAVAAREQSAAEEFAKDFPAKHKHGSYESLAQNPEVDVIYIATPHGFHHEHTMLCLKYKKAVLCEKAFAMNTRQVTEMITLAKAQGVFLMEAFWTKFLPHYNLVKQMITNGKIGSIKYITAEFGYTPGSPVPQRMFDPRLGGGSLYDIGIYPVFMTLDILGRPDNIEAGMTKASTGIDEQCAIRFDYKSGVKAQLFSTFAANLAGQAEVVGDKGRIRFTDSFHAPWTSLEFYKSSVDSKESVPFEKSAGFGYEYEARHVTECLQKGLIESPVMTHAQSLLIIETLDRIREKAGIRYPMD